MQVPTTPDNVPINTGISYVYISSVYNSSFPSDVATPDNSRTPPAAPPSDDWTVVEANICASYPFVSSSMPIAANPLQW